MINSMIMPFFTESREKITKKGSLNQEFASMMDYGTKFWFEGEVLNSYIIILPLIKISYFLIMDLCHSCRTLSTLFVQIDGGSSKKKLIDRFFLQFHPGEMLIGE